MLLNKIVVAEDDDSIAHMVNMALGDAGFLCLRARNGEEAINLVKVQSPDCLILDVMMPRCDGMEVVKRIRADVTTSRTPVLMLTALGGVADKVEGLEAGADDYVTKPFDLRELAARVKALIRASRRERDRSPTTGLPGSNAISEHLQGLLDESTPAAVLHIDAAGFDVYADQVGFAKAQDLVVALGNLITARARGAADAAFVGHLGGGDFIATCAMSEFETLAGDVIAGFEDSRARWTTDAGDDSPVRLCVGVAMTEGLGDDKQDEVLARRLAAALRASKQRDGSNFAVWHPDLA